eukprot:14630812-Alexandrium_andersonii.AAC.1
MLAPHCQNAEADTLEVVGSQFAKSLRHASGCSQPHRGGSPWIPRLAHAARASSPGVLLPPDSDWRLRCAGG